MLYQHTFGPQCVFLVFLVYKVTKLISLQAVFNSNHK